MTLSLTPRPVLLHVGYHKTATTWLQNRVFRPEFHFWQVMNHKEIFDTVIAPHGLDFDPARARKIIAERAAKAPAGVAVDVISLEALSGLPFTGGRESDDLARRLKAVLPEARILLTIREQHAIIASVYMQYLLRAGTQSPEAFFDGTPYDGYFAFSARNFEYDRLIGLYQDLFGPEQTLALPQELIAHDQPAAVALLGRFSGNAPLAGSVWTPARERGVSYPQYAVPLLRRINYFRREAMNLNPVIDLGRLGYKLYRGTGWLARRPFLPASWGKAKPVTDLVRRRFAGRFADSNRRLAGMLHHPVPLKGYEGIDAN